MIPYFDTIILNLMLFLYQSLFMINSVFHTFFMSNFSIHFQAKLWCHQLETTILIMNKIRAILKKHNNRLSLVTLFYCYKRNEQVSRMLLQKMFHPIVRFKGDEKSSITNWFIFHAKTQILILHQILKEIFIFSKLIVQPFFLKYSDFYQG